MRLLFISLLSLSLRAQAEETHWLEREMLRALCNQEHGLSRLPSQINTGCVGAIDHISHNLTRLRQGQLSPASFNRFCTQNYQWRRVQRGCETGLDLALQHFQIIPNKSTRFNRPITPDEISWLIGECRRALGQHYLSQTRLGCQRGVLHSFSLNNLFLRGELTRGNLEQVCRDYEDERKRMGCLQGVTSVLNYVGYQEPMEIAEPAEIETPEIFIAN